MQRAHETYTRAGYRALLETARDAGYVFTGFGDAAPGGELICLLRHDVDADLGAAVELARVEAELRVSATYFVMLRSPLYNAFARANQRLVEEILGLGHRLGLHYDIAFTTRGQRSPEDAIALEARVLGELVSARVEAFSFHQPAYGNDPGSLRPSGLVSAYDFPGFHYVSDANKGVECAALFDMFRTRAHPRVQLLIHPLWWATDDEALTTERAWERALLANIARAQEQLIATERAYGPPRSFRTELSR